MRAFTSRKSDKEIGMPDVEQELARLKARMAPSRSALPLAPSKNSPKGEDSQASSTLSNGGFSLRKIAAILMVALMLTGLGYAAVHMAPSNSPKGEECPASSTHSSAGQESSPLGELEGAVGDGVILFQDARLDSILMQIDQHYKVESRFADNGLRTVRLLFKWNKQHSLDEVLQRLNGFERFQIRRKENTLIVEQPQAEQ